MVRSLWTAASGMKAQQTNVDNISNNLANVNTTGFKKETVEFKSLLYQNLQSVSTNNAGEEKPIPAQVGLGTRVASITSSFTQGNLTASSNPFAMAIEGNGFFQVRGEDGEIYYTRDGNFSVSVVNGGSMLCTSKGEPLLDATGNPIVIPNGYDASKMSMDTYGNLFLENPINGQIVSMNQQVGLVQFNNPAGLEKVGGSLFRQTVASGMPVGENTGIVTRSKIHQKYAEASNVAVVDEMVNLIVAQRAYEMNSKAISASDDMLQQANNLRK